MQRRSHTEESCDGPLGRRISFKMAPGAHIQYRCSGKHGPDTKVSFLVKPGNNAVVYVGMRLRAKDGSSVDGWLKYDFVARGNHPIKLTGLPEDEWWYPFTIREYDDQWRVAEVDIAEATRRTVDAIGSQIECISAVRLRGVISLSRVVFE